MPVVFFFFFTEAVKEFKRSLKMQPIHLFVVSSSFLDFFYFLQCQWHCTQLLHQTQSLELGASPVFAGDILQLFLIVWNLLFLKFKLHFVTTRLLSLIVSSCQRPLFPWGLQQAALFLGATLTMKREMRALRWLEWKSFPSPRRALSAPSFYHYFISFP